MNLLTDFRLAHARVAHAACAALAAAALSACAQTTPAAKNSSDGGSLPARIEALKQRTLKNLMFVEGGSFMMGDFGELHNSEKLPYAGKYDALPPHKVTLDSYSIAAYKVTFDDYDVFTDVHGKPRAAMNELDNHRKPNVPAGASWPDARAYCQWIGQQINMPMDLPTEAQWEYAARSRGQMLLYATDNGQIDDGRNVASYEQRQAYAKASGFSNDARPMPVGQWPATPLGLYDLITNGFEWTLDWYAPDYYKNSPEKNPRGPETGTKKVQRGYAGSGGGSLTRLSLTFSRRSNEPNLPIKYKEIDPNNSNTIRCVVNIPQSIKR